MSLSNIKEGEEKQEDGKRKTHDCGGVETWEENEAVDILGKERQTLTETRRWLPGHHHTTKHNKRCSYGYLVHEIEKHLVGPLLSIGTQSG